MHTAIQAIDVKLLRDLPANSEDLESQQTLKITEADSIQKITKGAFLWEDPDQDF